MPPKSAARARRAVVEPIISNELGVVSEQSSVDADDFSDETAWTLPQLRAWLVDHDVMLTAVESKARKSVLLERCRARAAELQQERHAAAVVVSQPQVSKVATPQASRVQAVSTPVSAFPAPLSTPKSRQSAGTVTITPATPDDNEFQNRRASRGPAAYQPPQLPDSPMEVDELEEEVSMPVVTPGDPEENIHELPVEPSPQYGRRVSAFGIRSTPSAPAAAPVPLSSNRRASSSGASLFQPFSQSPMPAVPTPNRRASSGLNLSYQPMNFASPAVVKTPRGNTPAPVPTPSSALRVSTSSMEGLVDPFAENNRTPSSVRTPRDRASLQPVDMSHNTTTTAVAAAPGSENRRASTGSSFFGRSSAPTSHIPAQTWNVSHSVIDGSADQFDYTPPVSHASTPLLPKPSPLAASPAPVVPPSPATPSRARTQIVKEETFCDKATRKIRSFVMIVGIVLVSCLIGYLVSIWMRPIRFCNSNVEDGVVQTDCVPCPNTVPGSHVSSCVDNRMVCSKPHTYVPKQSLHACVLRDTRIEESARQAMSAALTQLQAQEGLRLCGNTTIERVSRLRVPEWMSQFIAQADEEVLLRAVDLISHHQFVSFESTLRGDMLSVGFDHANISLSCRARLFLWQHILLVLPVGLVAILLAYWYTCVRPSSNKIRDVKIAADKVRAFLSQRNTEMCTEEEVRAELAKTHSFLRQSLHNTAFWQQVKLHVLADDRVVSCSRMVDGVQAACLKWTHNTAHVNEM